MALQKQVVSIPLEQGLDTKQSPALIQLGKFLTLQNAVFTKGANGALHKRNGYVALPQVDWAGNALSNGTAIITLNNELEAVFSSSLYAYSPEISAWVPKGVSGNIVGCGVKETPIGKSAYNQSNCDSAVNSDGTVWYAWEDARGGVWYAHIDESSGTVLRQPTQANATGSCPKWLNTGTSLVLLLVDSFGSLWKYTVPPSSSTPLTGAVVVSTIAANGLFDACVVNGIVCIALQTSGASTSLLTYNTSLAFLHVVSVAVVVPSALSVAPIGATGISVAFASGGALTDSFYTITAVTGVITAGNSYTLVVSGPAIPNVTQIPASTSTKVYYQTEPSGSVDRFITQALVSTSSGVVSSGTFGRSLALASQPWAQGGHSYILAIFPSATQQTLFMLNENGSVVGKFYPQNAGPPSTHSRLPAAQNVGASMWSFAVTSQVSFVSQSGKIVVINAVSELRLDFTQTTINPAQLGQSLLVPTGSLLKSYDGTSVTEHGFNNYPEYATVAAPFSNIGVSSISGPPQVITYTFPQAPVGSGKTDGQLITPGEYIATGFAPGITTDMPYFYFVVDGVGADPGFQSNWTGNGVPVNISAAWTAAQIAAAVNTVMNITNAGTIGFRYFFFYQTGIGTSPNTVVSTARYSAGQPPGVVYPVPGVVGQFQCYQFATGDGTHPGVAFVKACSGAAIAPGQSFSIQGFGGSPVRQDFYFQVNGIGAFTAGATGAYGPIPVPVLSTDTEVQVAGKLVTAITGASVLFSATGYTNTPWLSVTNITNGATTLNALNTSVAQQGYKAYQYCAVFEWFDAAGQLHRSSPSVVSGYDPITLTSGYALPPFQPQCPGFTVTVPTLRLSDKSNVDVAIYRTQGNGSVFYRVTSPTALLLNTPGVDTLTFLDTTPDATITANEPLYTTGGVLPNDGPPAAAQLVIHQDRAWLLDLEDPQLMWFSQQFQNGLGVAFSKANTIRLDPTGGAIVAGASMDGNLIVFEQYQIWVITGPGPDSTGAGVGFSSPNLISSTVGLRDQNSLVLTPDGLMFKTSKGFYLCDRSFQVSYVGAGVEAYNSDICSSGQTINDSTQIRFTSTAGTTLLYDYLYQQWSTFTNHQGTDSIKWNGVYYYITPGGTVLQEVPGSTTDNGVAFPMVVTTGWIKFGAIQQFQRIWKAFWLGFFPGTSPIQVGVAYDENPAIIDTETLWPTAGTASIWGADATWGLSSPWGGTAAVTFPPLYEFRQFPGRQQCNAIQFTIQDLSPYSNYYLDSLDLEFGVKKGGNKLPASASTG